MRDYEESAVYIIDRIKTLPIVGIVCGSGLSTLSEELTDKITISFDGIPNFPPLTVQGHFGELVFGNLNDLPVVCMRGRYHSYEGHTMQQVALPVQVMKLLGVKLLIVTNSSGALNAGYNVGDIMVMNDHFALPLLAGKGPLVGKNDDNLGPRFVSISDTYNEDLQALVAQVGNELGHGDRLHNGVYCFVSGPAYESKSESLFLRSVGDCVGMSTIPEVVAAKHCGMHVIGMALMTNKVIMPGEEKDRPPASHAEVLANTDSNAMRVREIVKDLVCSKHLLPFLSDNPELNPLSLNSNPVTGSPHATFKHASSSSSLNGKENQKENEEEDDEECKNKELASLIHRPNKYAMLPQGALASWNLGKMLKRWVMFMGFGFSCYLMKMVWARR
jgi:purine-nucleoside phosphorylase